MSRHRVHAFPIGHVILGEIDDAQTMPEAIDKALKPVDMYQMMQDGVEFNEGYDAFLVDVVGDEELSESRWFGPDGETPLYPAEIGEPVQFNIWRDSRDETTFAVVTARVTEDGLRHISTFRDVLKDALTEWVNTTQAGRDAWAESSEDFNVGDLCDKCSDAELQDLLKARGIHNLSVETYAWCGNVWSWTFDEVLVNEDEIKEEEDVDA